MNKKDDDLITILKPSKFKGKSLKSLRRKNQNKPPPITGDGCPGCEKIARKLYDLKRRGGYFIQQKQDKAVWMPLTESEKKAGNNIIRTHKFVRLCPHCESIAKKGWVNYWQMVPGHKRGGFSSVGKRHEQRSGAGADADFKTYQDMQTGNMSNHVVTATNDSNPDIDKTLWEADIASNVYIQTLF